MRALMIAVLLGSSSAQADTRMRFVTEQLPPYSMASADGQAGGPLVEVLLEACGRLGWQCSVEILPWRRALRMAERGEVEGVLPIRETPERRTKFRFSVPLAEGRYAVLAKAGDSRIYRGPALFAQRSVGVYGPSGTSEALQEVSTGQPNVDIVIEGENRTVLTKLAAGRYGPQGLALMSESVALNLLREDGMPGVQMVGSLPAFSYRIGLVQGVTQAAQVQALNAALGELCRSGRTAELLRRHGIAASPCSATR